MSKILVVDDDPDFLLLSRSILEAEGYEVLAATGGEEALAAMNQDMPDLVFLDVAMSSMLEGVKVSRGIEAARRLETAPAVATSTRQRATCGNGQW